MRSARLDAERRDREGRLLLWMFALATLGIEFAIARTAHAQAPATGDLTERPSAAVCTVRFQDPNLGPGLETCLIKDPADEAFLDRSTHFECRTFGSSGPAQTAHSIIVPVGGGDVKVWGVVVRAETDGSFGISNPSQLWKECEDVPQSPILISGHPPLEDSIA